MGYSGTGFFNTRSGTWVSSAHAAQHVGQTVNGWTKRLSSGGNFYMAKAGGLALPLISALGMANSIPDPFEEYNKIAMLDTALDLVDPERGKAKKEVIKLTADIKTVLNIQNEIEEKIKKAFGTDKSLTIKKEFKSLFKKTQMIIEPEWNLNDVLQELMKCFFDPLTSNYKSVLNSVSKKIKLINQYTKDVERLIAREAGVTAFFILNDEAKAICKEVYKNNNINVDNLDGPYFFGTDDSGNYGDFCYICGADFPEGQYYFMKPKESIFFNIKITRNNKCVLDDKLCTSGYLVDLLVGDEVEVQHGIFSMHKYLTFPKEEIYHNGTYVVGKTIDPGNYTVLCEPNGSWFEVLDKPLPDCRVIKKATYSNGKMHNVSLKNGQCLFLCNCDCVSDDLLKNSDNSSPDLSSLKIKITLENTNEILDKLKESNKISSAEGIDEL